MKNPVKNSVGSQFAYGLVEVLIAIAILAGLALLISQMLPQQQKSIFKTTERAECQNRVQNILGSIKKYDNQIQAYSWLPGNGRPDDLDPRLNTSIPWAATRVTQSLMGNFPSPVYTSGQILVPPANVKLVNYAIPRGTPGGANQDFNPDAVVMTDYYDDTHHELDVVQYGNVWQLIQNSATLLYPYYNQQCAGTALDLSTGFLGSAVGQIQLPGEQDTIQIERINLSTGAILPCAAWEPLPLNSNPSFYFSAPVAPLVAVNHQIGYKVTATVNYQDRSTNQRVGCEGNTTVSPGAYLNPLLPSGITRLQSNVVIKRISRTGSGFLPNQPSIACSPPANEVGWEIGPSCGPTGCEQGIAYLCRLDYIGVRNATNAATNPNPPTVIYPQRSTGWFICSLPPAGLDARGDGQLTTLTVENLSDLNSSTYPNFMDIYLGGKIWEGQYRLHLMGVDRARNLGIAASNISIDTEVPRVIDITPPAEIKPMGFYSMPRYGHLGSQTIPLGPRVGDPPNANSPWQALKGSFNSIVTPHQNLFQCQATAGAWTISAGPGNANDLNIASNNGSGLTYGPVGAVLNPTCGQYGNYVVPGSGEYQVKAIACDACPNHVGTTMTKQWYADLEATNPNPTGHSAVLSRGQVASLAMSFNRTSTLKTLNIMPVAHSCERYAGATPKWAASLATVSGAQGTSACWQQDWETAFGDSCTSDPTAIPRDDQCFIAVDGCGRFTARPFDTNYTVNGGSIAAPASRDCCSGVSASPFTGFGNSPACTNDGFGTLTDYVCSDGSLTTGNPMCARLSEIQWTGVRSSTQYTISACAVGETDCPCWKDTECRNNMQTNAQASCPATTVTCEGPYTVLPADDCPGPDYVRPAVLTPTQKRLYTNATVNPPVNDTDACDIPVAVTCSHVSGPVVVPAPTIAPNKIHAVGGAINTGVKFNIATNYCDLPGPTPQAIAGCSSPGRCPVMTDACVAAPPPTPTPPTCVAPEEPCVVGDPRWSSCSGVPLCGPPACPGDPAGYQWSAPPFDSAIQANCDATVSITNATCSPQPPKRFYSIPISVPRIAPGIQCLNGATVAADYCCTDVRPPDTTTCNVNSCDTCPSGGSNWVYGPWVGPCDPGATNHGPNCNGHGVGVFFCCDADIQFRPGTCMSGGLPVPNSCCTIPRERRTCGCREWACTPAGGRPGIDCR